MFKAWAQRLVTGRQTTAQPPAAVAPAVAAADGRPQLRYPPSDEGLPILAPDDLLAANTDLIERLRTHAATSTANFETRFLTPIRRLAEQVNVLPASSTGLFSGETGLLRAAIECAFFSFQASDGRIFTGSATVEMRHTLEGRWRYLCFLAGLLYPVGKTLERAVVTTDQGLQWPRHHGALTTWATEAGAQRLFISWGTTQDADAVGPSNAGLMLLPAVVGPTNLQHLEDGSSDLVAALYELVLGKPGSAPIAHQVLTGAWERIVRREEARRPLAFGRQVAGSHLGPYLAGAIRAQIESGAWRLNAGPLKADPGGMYLVWPAAAADLLRFGQQQGYAGWPTEPSTLAELLAAAGIVERRSSDLGLIELVDAEGEILKAYKVANPLALVEEFDPASFATPLTLAALQARDPLAGAGEAAPPAAPAHALQASAAAPADAAAPALAPLAVTQSAADHTQVSSASEPPASVAAEPKAHSARRKPTTDERASAPAAPLKLEEAPVVNFSDLVPEDVRKDIRNSMQAELLGKILKLWRDRPADSPHMWRGPNGAVFTAAFLSTHIRSLPDWVQAMAAAGLIYTPAQTPGAKVHKVTPVGGGKAVDAIVLSDLACRKMGL